MGEPAPPAEIELSVESVPEHVEVYLGETKLGTAPGPLRLRYGREKLVLVLKAEGYLPQKLELTPTSNRVISARLLKAGPARPAEGKKPELEF